MSRRNGTRTVVAAIALVLLAAAVFASRGSLRAIQAAGGGSSNEVAVEAKDDGRQIAVQKGQTLVVRLEANPSTGYSWEASDLDGAILKPVGDPTFDSQSTLVGAPGVQTLRFEVVGTGSTTLKLVYHRPWEKDVPPQKTFGVQVVVK